MRRTSFRKDAESVQRNAGAWIEFKNIKRGIVRRLFDNENREITVPYLIKNYVLDWSGIRDDEGNDLPSPKDEPGVVDELYRDEESEIVNLLIAGPDPESPN